MRHPECFALTTSYVRDLSSADIGQCGKQRIPLIPKRTGSDPVSRDVRFNCFQKICGSDAGGNRHDDQESSNETRVHRGVECSTRWWQVQRESAAPEGAGHERNCVTVSALR